MQSEVWFYNQVEPEQYLYREMIAAEPRNKGKPIDDASLLPELSASLARHAQGKHLVYCTPRLALSVLATLSACLCPLHAGMPGQ